MMKFLKKSLSAVAFTVIAAGSVFSFPGVSSAQETTQPVTVTPTTQSEVGERPVFIPLTNLPGLQEVADSESLAGFFNQLYRLCIGAAAVIAVLQIMRAGALHMFNKGSLSQSQNVRSLIQNSVLGLVLVLSPAIVFGIINPSILDISLDFGVLKPEALEEVISTSTLATGIDITITGEGIKDGTVSCDTEDVVEADRAACSAFEKKCADSNGDFTIRTGVANACPNNAATCVGKLGCIVGDSATPSETPQQNQPSTNELLTTEYEWRFLVKNANGGLISSIPGQTWPARGQGIWGARYPNKQACMEVQEGFLTWIRDNRAESNWTVDTSICNCSQPRGEFAQCRQ